MNGIYSNEVHTGSEQFRPDCGDLLEREFGSRPWASGEKSPLESSIDFDYDFEQEFARMLDQHSIPWQYKPRTFAVEWDEDGIFIDSFTPGFYLPTRDLYLEIVAPNCRVSNERARKARLLRQEHPAIKIEVLSAAKPYQVTDCLC